jgi:hypothetical protein
MNPENDPDISVEFEQAIKKLALAPTSSSLESRMANLFETAPASESSPLKRQNHPRILTTSLTIAASLLVGFGAGTWYGRLPGTWPSPLGAGAVAESIAPVDGTAITAEPTASASQTVAPTTELPRAGTVSRNTTLSAPLWLESKDGRVFRSYIATTKEDIVEIDPTTQKKKLVQRHMPRLVISNSPGI